MTAVLTVNGINRTSKWRAAESNFAMAASRGESVQSEIVLDDTGLMAHADLASRKIVTLTEDAPGSAVTLYRGRIATKQSRRGDSEFGDANQWVIQLEDYNVDLDGISIVSWDRPEETDRARVLALMAAFLNGASSTDAAARDSTQLATTYVANSNLITLPAEMYTDETPQSILERISELAGKTFFVTVDGELYYDTDASTAYAASLSISDTNPNGTSIFAPIWLAVPADHDGQMQRSGGSVRYGQDSIYTEHDVFGAEANHDKWEQVWFDEYVTDDLQAQRLLQMLVSANNSEHFGFACALKLGADQVNLIKCGQTLSFEASAAGAYAATTQRVVRLRWEPLLPGFYYAHLELGFPRNAPVVRNLRRKPTATPVPKFPPLQDEPPVLDLLWTYAGGDTKDTTATYTLMNSWWDGSASWRGTDGSAFGYNGLSGSLSSRFPVSVGQVVKLSGRFWPTGNDAQTYVVEWFSSVGAVNPFASEVILTTNPVQDVPASLSGSLVAPTGAVEFRLAIERQQANDSVSLQVLGVPAAHAIPAALAGTSPFVQRSDSKLPTTQVVHGSTPVSTVLGDLLSSPNVEYVDKATAPGIGDDEEDGYSPGSVWLNTTDDELYVNIDATPGAAVWIRVPRRASLNFVIDGGGAAITTGIKGDVVIDFDCTIESVTMLADQSGSIVVDIWKDTYANFPPTVADTITAAAKPTITTATKSQDGTLTGWTKTISAGQILRFNVDSATAIQRLTLELKLRRT